MRCQAPIWLRSWRSRAAGPRDPSRTWRRTRGQRDGGEAKMSSSGSPGGHVVVTGVSSGIGAAIAARLLHDGWTVTGLSRTNPGQLGPGFAHRAVDLLDPSQLPGALEGLQPTALVHAAGLMRAGS